MKKALIEYSDSQIKRLVTICNPKLFQNFLQHNSRKYQKYYNGFMEKSLKLEKIQTIMVNLVLTVHDLAATELLQNRIDSWLHEIKDEFNVRTQKYNTQTAAVASTLLDSMFCNDIPLYFEICEESYDADTIDRILAQIVVEQKLREQQNDNAEQLKQLKLEHEAKIKEIESQYKMAISEQKTKHEKELQLLSDKNNEGRMAIIELNKQIEDLSAENNDKAALIAQMEAEIVNLNNVLCQKENDITSLKNHIDTLSTDSQQLREQQAFIEKNKSDIKIIYHGASSTFDPLDGSFESILEENLYNIGYSTAVSGCLQILVCNAIRNKLPIMASMQLANNISKCIAATVDAGEYVGLVFNNDKPSIDSFANYIASLNRRVVQLDCCIGRLDDGFLFALLDACKQYNKIFVLSLTYEKQIRFFPEEILQYVEYISTNEMLIDDSSNRLCYFISEQLSLSTHEKTNYSLCKKLINNVGLSESILLARSRSDFEEADVIAYFACEFIPFMHICRDSDLDDIIESLDNPTFVEKMHGAL